MAIKCLRNACGGSSSNSDIIIQNGIQTCMDVLGHYKENKDINSDDYQLMVVCICQLCANLAACGEPSTSLFWSQFGVKLCCELLAISVNVRSDRALGAALAVVYNCIAKPISESYSRQEDMLQSKQLCAQIVLSVMDLKFTAGSNENSYKRSTEAGKPRNGDALEWLHLTVLLLTQRGSFPRLLQLVGPAETTSISSVPSPRLLLTHEQVVYLHVLQGVLEDPHFLDTTSSSDDCMIDIVKCISSILLPSHLTSRAEEVEVLDFFRMVNGVPASPACIQTLSSVLNYTHDKHTNIFAPIRELILSSGVLRLCVSFLAAYRLSKSNPIPGGSSNLHMDSNDWNVPYAHEVVKACLSLIMNASYRFEVIQNAARDLGAMPVILSYCATDFDNPLSREYALMCVRNMCEGNRANQEFVESLQPQEVLQDPVLQAQGIRVEIDPLSGKFKFQQS
eukprot:CAMPEP_0185032922 /NCGR_PEP_ID=MMETSP1103-20130426/21461_1 /TAXON_ID=36769 /ORGANISM="Paraphysomonas bandaiensis, Strain Caron Lab Isolate" /LENGTH=450 /DNA_ID=CAMNT_0027569009 /DNA_START=76 /DNA_END=1428 /DNA_ORIENTATION=+